MTTDRATSEQLTIPLNKLPWLNPRPGQQMMSFQLLSGMLQLTTKNKSSIERAVNDFLSLASMEQQGRENVGAILGMATAYQLLKQTPK